MAIHINRGAESIIYRDRDIISIIPMTAEFDIDISTISEPGSNGYTLYTVEEKININDRFLAYSRVDTSGKVKNGVHAAFWVDGEGSTVANFFKEVISPKITFDPNSNVMSMIFWTNFTLDEEGEKPTKYDVDNIWYIDEFKYDPTTIVHPALCVSYGTIQRWNVEGGVVNSSGGGDGPDIIPVFQKPQIIMFNPHSKDPCTDDVRGLLDCVPMFDFSPEIRLFKAVADEDETENTIEVKTVDVEGEVCEDDDVIVLNTISDEEVVPAP